MGLQINVNLRNLAVKDRIVGQIVEIAQVEGEYGERVIFKFVTPDGKEFPIAMRLTSHPNSLLARFIKSIAEAIGEDTDLLIKHLNAGDAPELDGVWFVLERQSVSFGVNRQSGSEVSTTAYMVVGVAEDDEIVDITPEDEAIVELLRKTGGLHSEDPLGELLFRIASSPEPGVQALYDMVASDPAAYIRRLMVIGLLRQTEAGGYEAVEQPR